MIVIGKTPLIKLERLSEPGAADIYVKMEGANPTGSMKDRMALSMIEGAERRGDLRSGGTVVDYTGGSTGGSLAMVCAAGSMIALKHISSRYDPWFLTGLQAAVGAVFFLPGAIAGGTANWAAAAPVAWMSVAYMGTFVSLAAFGLYNTAIVRMPANRAALSINLVPAVALLAGWSARGETLSPLQLVACAVIVGAVVLSETGASPVPPSEAIAAVEFAVEGVGDGES